MNENNKKKKIDLNLIIAIGVLIASFAALFVYVRQASIMSEQTKILLEQSKLSAWPNLSIRMSKTTAITGVREYGIYISNRGTGPAIIEKTVVSYLGKPIKNWKEFYEVMGVPDTINRGQKNENIYDKVIRPNEDFRFVDWSHNKDLMNYIYKNADKISIAICYKSVYDDCWQVKRNGFKNNLEKIIRVKTDKCALFSTTPFEE